MECKKLIKIFLLILFGFLGILLLAYFMPLSTSEVDKAYDLFYTETLPEDELDRLLVERGIDTKIIAVLPIWEKQYLIDRNVDMASFGEEKEWNPGSVYGRLPKENFSMQMVVARIWEESGRESEPSYRLIIPYAWRKLPVWTGKDDLLLFIHDPWMHYDDRKVEYVRERDGQIKQAREGGMRSAGSHAAQWEIDISRKFQSIVKDGYIAVTLTRKHGLESLEKKEKGENTVFEVRICYTHNIMALTQGAWLTGGEGFGLRRGIRTKHYFRVFLASF